MDSSSDFIKERLYLKGVSPRTVIWYNCSFKAFQGALDSKKDIITRIAELKGRGVSHITINSYLRCINAYFRWLHTEQELPLLKIPKLKEEQKVLATLSSDQVERLLRHHPKGINASRAWHASMIMLDSGLRISEVLSLTGKSLDFDNLIIKVKGKGSKERLVPMSLELRRSLYRYVKDKEGLVFTTRTKTAVSVRNFQRDFKLLCEKVGIKGVRCSPHSLRHTMATNWIRKGGDIYMLQRVLGHASITTTTIYLKSLGIGDIMETAQRVSLLSR